MGRPTPPKTEIPRPTDGRPVAAWLMIAAVPVAAVLSFMVQPMMGKRLLPIYGGAASTWLGAMVFFQMSLLLGYGWATWLLSRPPRFQKVASLVLAGLALATFHLPSPDTATGGILQIVGVLSLHTLPAMMLLFSISPLMHGWLRRQGGQVPYHIYALSNFGSLAGLVSYPFLIEPHLGLGVQRWIVHGGIALVAALIAVAIGLESRARHSSPAATAESAPESELLPAGRLLAWLGLSLVTCLTMLGATELVAAELGSSPLAWVGPFAAYLLSFMVVFSGIWRPWMTTAATVGLIISLTDFMFEKGLSSLPLAGRGYFSLIAAVGCACLVGNALLFQLRPAVRFDRFYLALAAGGVAGGLLVSLVLPHVFARPAEFLLGAGILHVGAAVATAARRESGPRLVAGVLAIVPLAGLALVSVVIDSQETVLKHFRNEYGHVFTRTTSAMGQSKVELLSESTIHGSQIHSDRVSARRPTQYYTESGGAGRTLLFLRQGRPALRIGVIGLGAGTLAAYGRPGDFIRFWDIDPKIITIAQNEFTYLRDSLAKVEVAQEDGRRALAASTEDFDVIVVDAFSGDGVPAHLVTVEAMQVYLARLAARQGTLVIHVSSRYNEPFQILANTALAAGRTAFGVTTFIGDRGENVDWHPTDTDYVIIPPPGELAALRAVFPENEDNGRVTRKLFNLQASLPDPRSVWTDDRHAAIEMLDLHSFLTWRNRF